MGAMDRAVDAAEIRAEITLTDTEKPEGFDPAGNSWAVKLRHGRRSMSFPFFTGSLAGEPTTADVVGCIVMDWSSQRYVDGFEDWAREMGMDTDSRSAEAIFRAVEKQSQEAERVLGVELLEQLAEVEW